MNDFRIQVNRIDRSQTLIADAINIGAMGIRSKRKRTEPIFVGANDRNTILDLYGNPSATYPDVAEAIAYNAVEGMWLFSPVYDLDTVGGVDVTNAGVTGFTEGIDPANPSVTFADSDHLFSIYSKFVVDGDDDLSATVTYDSDNERFTIVITKDDREVIDETVSLTEGARDGFGRNIYIEDVFEDNDFVGVILNPDGVVDTFTDTTSAVSFSGNDFTDGYIDETTEQEYGDVLATAWEQFKNTNRYNLKVAMDATADPGIPAVFDSLRDAQKYCRFILPLPIGEDAQTSIETKEGYGIDNYGLAFYANHGRIRNTWSGGSFWTALTGRIGAKYAAMSSVFNAENPAFSDENGFGGQLGGGIIELDQSYSDTDLQELDAAGINPIVQEPGTGVIIAGGKTAQNPNNMNDYSFVAHVGLFDYIIENVVNLVLKPQRGKLNDDVHRDAAASRSDILLSPIAAANYLNDYAVVCDLSNNTPEALARREFVLTIVVQVTPFSERLILNFANIGQTTTVDEFFG